MNLLLLLALFIVMCYNFPSFPLNWGMDVVAFLKGCAPVLAAFLGLICLFIGAADIKDKNEAKKEEREAKAKSEN